MTLTLKTENLFFPHKTLQLILTHHYHDYAKFGYNRVNGSWNIIRINIFVTGVGGGYKNALGACTVQKAGVIPDPTTVALNMIFVPCSCLLYRCPHRLAFSWWGCYVLYLRHKPTKLAHSFHSVLVSVSVSMVLSTVFHSINSPNNSSLSHSVLLVLFQPYWSFRLYISLWKSPSVLI